MKKILKNLYVQIVVNNEKRNLSGVERIRHNGTGKSHGYRQSQDEVLVN